jgi:hypothetical protein
MAAKSRRSREEETEAPWTALAAEDECGRATYER